MRFLTTKNRLALIGCVLLAAAVGVTVAVASSADQPLSPQKQALLAHQFATPPDAAPPAAKNPNVVITPEVPQPQVPLQQITTSDIQVPLPAASFSPTSQWLNVVGSVQTVIYAGSAPMSGGTGAIYVWITDLTNGKNLAGTGLFTTGQKASITLTGVNVNTVTFSSPTGTGTFDLATHAFGG